MPAYDEGAGGASLAGCAVDDPDGLHAAIADGIDAVVAAADIVILSLPTAEIVERVVEGAGGILAHARAGVIIVDT